MKNNPGVLHSDQLKIEQQPELNLRIESLHGWRGASEAMPNMKRPSGQQPFFAATYTMKPLSPLRIHILSVQDKQPRHSK